MLSETRLKKLEGEFSMTYLELLTSFDLEILAETSRILKKLKDNELVAMEQRNRADFCARYCDRLQERVESHVVTNMKGDNSFEC